MSPIRKAWVQRLVEAGTSELALATVSKVWRAGPRTLFDLAARGNSDWIRLAELGNRLASTPEDFLARSSR